MDRATCSRSSTCHRPFEWRPGGAFDRSMSRSGHFYVGLCPAIAEYAVNWTARNEQPEPFLHFRRGQLRLVALAARPRPNCLLDLFPRLRRRRHGNRECEQRRKGLLVAGNHIHRHRVDHHGGRRGIGAGFLAFISLIFAALAFLNQGQSPVPRMCRCVRSGSLRC
jgi:hypothetical protein